MGFSNHIKCFCKDYEKILIERENYSVGVYDKI